jgi:V/A-type H+-transporting ATPase subunit K
MHRKQVQRLGMMIAIFGAILMGLVVWGSAQEAEPVEAAAGLTDAGLKALGAGLAFLGGAVGTGLAQSRIIAAVLGAVVEDPGQLGIGIFLIAIPETLVILGFVVIFIL